MALDGLVSRNIGSYVRDLRLEGSWKEVGLEDFEKGRVPDNSMMLNIVVKAALDKMEKLESFWYVSTLSIHYDGRPWIILMRATAGNSAPNLYERYTKVSARERPSSLSQFVSPQIEYHARLFSCLAYRLSNLSTS